jgi:hypothetical protein
MISIAEFAARVRRLRKILPDLEVTFHVDEGLQLRCTIDGKSVTFTGETDVVLRAEGLAKIALERNVSRLDLVPGHQPFPVYDEKGFPAYPPSVGDVK